MARPRKPNKASGSIRAYAPDGSFSITHWDDTFVMRKPDADGNWKITAKWKGTYEDLAELCHKIFMAEQSIKTIGEELEEIMPRRKKGDDTKS